MNHDILLTYDRNPLRGYTPEAFVEKLVSMLRGSAVAAYLNDDLLDAFPILDILVYTPAEFEELTSDPSPGFWSSVVAEMRRIV